MAKFKFFKFKKNWQNWLTVGLGVLIFAGSVIGISSLVKKANEDTKTISLTYSVGGLDANGKYEETEDSIYTKDAFECQGLKITPDFDSQVSYEVFFYDLNGQFLESSGVLTDFYDKTPFVAKYARIELLPEADNKVSWYEVSKYANDIKVEVSKNQNIDVATAVRNLENKAVIKGAGQGGFKGDEFLFTEGVDATYFIEPLNVADVHSLVLKIESAHLGTFSDGVHYCVEVFDIYGRPFNLTGNVLSEQNGMSYVYLNVSEERFVGAWICVDLLDSFAIYML